MKKFCNIHRFYFDTVCPYCTKDKYGARNDKPEKEDTKLTAEKIEELKRHFAR